MTVITESSTIVDCESKFWVESEWLDMIRLDFCAMLFASPDALIVISCEYRLAPEFIL
ncbi:MAG: hypothetical protein UY34_C0033G0005 [Parcubacteria group bacterium GW2011_GWA2_48_9]|nr:MAG: hypothetical protein UY34_C0033G0005 [Parcubacteria group bacterium GW2011_GWA2_48_9]